MTGPSAPPGSDGAPLRITWATVFIDVPDHVHGRATPFWAAVVDARVSPQRGDDGEFATLLPPVGADHVRLQRVHDGWPRVHLDLHVEDPRAGARVAVALGARVIDERGHIVLASPHGFPFCLVGPRRGARAAPAVEWSGGQASALDQVCLDIAPDVFDEELAFWESLTGWARVETGSPEFERLGPGPDQPLQLLLQRLDEPDEGGGRVRAHLDLGTSPGGRDAEVERHVGLGARVLRRDDGWTVLVDPVGMAYCVTDHPPRHP